MTATCDGIRIVNVYVPNGRALDADHYQYKLGVARPAGRPPRRASPKPGDDVILAGDFNIAPADADVYDPAKFVGTTHTSEPERERLSTLLDWGLNDVFRQQHPDAGKSYSWWDYRAGDFHQGRGMRIDLVLASSLGGVARVEWIIIDRNARKGKLPSDHAPVVVDLADVTTRADFVGSAVPGIGTTAPRFDGRRVSGRRCRGWPGRREQAVGRQHAEAGHGGQRLGRRRRGRGDGQAARCRSTAPRAAARPPWPSGPATPTARRAPGRPAGRSPSCAARTAPARAAGVDVEPGDQGARPPGVAAAPPGPGDDEAVRWPWSGRRAGAAPPRPAAAFVRGRAVGDEPGLDAGDDDRRPLPALGGVERQQLDAGEVGVVERVGRRHPPPERRPVARRAARGGTPARPRPRRGRRRRPGRRRRRRPRVRRACRGPTPGGGPADGKRGRPSARPDRAACRPRGRRRSGTPAAASVSPSRVSWWLVRASTATPPARTTPGSSERTNAATSDASWASSSAGDHAHDGTVRARRHGGAGGVGRPAARGRRRRRSAACSDGWSGGG